MKFITKNLKVKKSTEREETTLIRKVRSNIEYELLLKYSINPKIHF